MLNELVSNGVSAKSVKQSKRARVLEVAAKTLNSFGVSRVSLPHVAQQLGISRAALYYYFDDQEDLVFQSYQRSCDILAERLDDAVEAGGDDPMAVIEMFVDGLLGRGAPEIAALSDLAYLGAERRRMIFGKLNEIKTRLANLLAAGSESGRLRHCAQGVVAAAILGLVSWPPVARVWRSSASLSHQDMIDAIKSLLREGIAADRSAQIDYQPLDLRNRDLPVGQIFDTAALAAAKQETLLAVASWLFNLKGVDATSLDEIALQLGVTKKVIYHNVGDKETLVAECYRRSFRLYETIAKQAAARSSPLNAIIASTATFAEANLREDIAPLAPINGIEALSANVQEEINGTSIWLMDRFIDLYSQGQAEGTIRPLNPRAILAINPGSFEWLPKWYDALSDEERVIAPQELARLNHIGLLAV